MKKLFKFFVVILIAFVFLVGCEMGGTTQTVIEVTAKQDKVSISDTEVLNYDFKNVNNKVDFCHMLNEMDNKDLAFLKECFEAIRNRDLKKMTSLIMEIKKAKEIYKNIENNKVM